MELVWELPAKAIIPHVAAEPGDSDEDPFCSFWNGDDPRIHAELCELLDKENIPHKTVLRADHLFHISNFPAFQIGIPFSMFERGEAAVKEAYGSEESIEPASRLLPSDSEHISGTRFDPGMTDSGGRFAQQNAQDTEGRPIGEAPVDATSQNESTTFADSSGHSEDDEQRSPEDAATEVWSGDEPETAEFIAASLQINQIQFRQDVNGDTHALYVFAEDESRAREIVREVVEGVPPE
ncbi:MAG: hypothetical protein WCE50_01715 [Candidatus Acidiferrum sp.]